MKTIATILAVCGVSVCLSTGLAFTSLADSPRQDPSTSDKMPEAVVTPRDDGGIIADVSPEAAAELKAALRKPKETASPGRQNGLPATEPEVFDYNREIDRAKQNGTPQDVRILTLCRDTPTGGKILTPEYLEDRILSLCKVRDFDVESTDTLWRPEISRSTPPPGAGSHGVSAKVAACRAEARKHVITCAKVTDYQNCEPWGCPEIVECDKRLTRCDDHGAPYDRSGTFYCDTRNWRTRDFDLNALLERTCPSD